MNYSDASAQLSDYRRQIAETREKMRAVQKAVEPEPVADYTFTTTAGPVRLSELFGGKADLFVIHNMGTGCPYCTLWADGYNGVYDHLENRAGFALSSPDTPDVQKSFADSRGWRFPMVSHAGTSFASDMGYVSERGGCMPGVSVFKRRNGAIQRVSDTSFGPGDDFCSVWHFLDMLPDGAAGWSPRFRYV
ncbi:MAG TPA: DUF899 family protein [Propylenella sp.]